MTATGTGAPAEAERALRRRLAQTLLADIDALTGRVVADIRAHSQAYASGRPVSLSDLHGICRENLVLALEDFGELPASAGDITAAATETGRRRAEQGMPLATVLLAYRRGGRVLWQAMTEPLRGRSAAEQDLGLEVAGALWETIDRFSTVMSDAYRRTQLELHHRQDSRRGALFEALLEGRGSDPAVAADAAAALGIPPRDRYAVVVVDQDPAAPPNPGPALRDAGMWSFWRPRAERYAGVVRLGGLEPDELAAVLRKELGGTAGVSPPFEELAEADTALRLAERALRTLPPGSGRVAALDERLVEAVLTRDPEIAERLLCRYLDGVLRSGSEGPVLLETLRVWLDAGCSASRAAELLYCHRNTVLNRIARVAELTGRPQESGEARLGWALALRAAEVPR
ncbi:PucR family transcriptional regulator [Streptomyces sp. A7024]|uniref:PucR family transcriptional regulator n=1 Tax=Streptomyces coryli TaxID=1128680 RepID=A0A6G4TZ57_9ACTN|nr:PucR family transcriptional regulator [Streptomyces coryli]NGN64736.1 PucR family transcriptional regulator [Streptomyces coryli]